MSEKRRTQSKGQTAPNCPSSNSGGRAAQKRGAPRRSALTKRKDGRSEHDPGLLLQLLNEQERWLA
jgi:hypothetical protein